MDSLFFVKIVYDGPLGERVKRFHLQFDRYRSAIVNELRGSDPIGSAQHSSGKD
jgi:hypothetical protein